MPRAVVDFSVLVPERADAYENNDLRDLVDVFRSERYLPDAGPLLVTLAMYAGYCVSRQPPWLMIVGGPSGGKTDVVNGLSLLPGVQSVGSLTAPALLSGSGKRDRAAGATGGLLRQIGNRGFVVVRNFTSILSMKHESLQQVLAASREIYDGHYTRHLGNEGGKVLTWHGHIGVVAAVTSAIDAHSDVMSKLGERFLYYRLSDMDADEQHAIAETAIWNCTNEDEDAVKLASLVGAFFEKLGIPESSLITPEEQSWLASVATVVARARSGVDRNNQTRNLESVHHPESPARLASQLTMLLSGLKTIGVKAPYRYRLVRKVAFDCVPPARAKVLHSLATADRPLLIKQIAEREQVTDTTKRRAVEDLSAHRMIRLVPEASDRESVDEDIAENAKSAYRYVLDAQWLQQWNLSRKLCWI